MVENISITQTEDLIINFNFTIDGIKDSISLSISKIFDWMISGLDREDLLREKFEGQESMYVQKYFVEGPLLIQIVCIKYFVKKIRLIAQSILDGTIEADSVVNDFSVI